MSTTPRLFDSVIVGTGQAGKPLAAYQAIRDAVYAHPTLAEPVQNLFARLDG